MKFDTLFWLVALIFGSVIYSIPLSAVMLEPPSNNPVRLSLVIVGLGLGVLLIPFGGGLLACVFFEIIRGNKRVDKYLVEKEKEPQQ